MNKKILYVLIPLTIVGGFYFWPKEKPLIPKKEKKIVSENRKLFLGKRKSLPVVQNNPKSTCDLLLSQLNELDVSGDLEDWKDQIKTLALDTCKDPDVLEKVKLTKETCTSKKDLMYCQTELMFLRSLLRTRGVKFSDDHEMIADLIISEFAKKTPDFKRLEKLVNELLNRNPENQSYQKLWAMNKLMANIEKNPLPSHLKDDIYDRLDPELLNHPDLSSYRLFLETGLDPMKAESFARSFLDQFPGRADLHETLGWSLWQQNRRTEALAQVERALRLNPKDPWLKDVYSRIKDPKASLESYPGRINMGVRFEDLYQ